MTKNNESFDFAAWTKLLPPSEIRALLEYKVKYNFGGGLPGALPVETLSDILIEIGNENKEDYTTGKKGKAISLWNYGPTGGQEFCLSVLAERLRRIDDINLDEETGWKDVILTAGSQQAIYAILDTMIDPGDVILTPSPAYLGFLAPAFKLGAEIVTIPTDLDGMIPEYIEKAIPLCEKKFGKKPNILYVVPDSDNPKGTTLPWKRRKALFDIGEEHDILIIEDQAYKEIQFQGELIKPIKSLDRDNSRVAYLRTTSKEAAVLRMGYSVLPESLKNEVLKSKGYLDLCSPTILQKVMAIYYEKYIDKVLPVCLKAYEKNAIAMLKGVDETFPAGSYTKPNGGFFVWYESEKQFNSKEFLMKTSIPNDIMFVPGAAFYPIKGWSIDESDSKLVDSIAKTNTMRLGYSYNNDKDIYDGITKLGKLLTKELD
ncbi:MAG: PLP-dependent aminotransferase family protein [Candidatus Heimdallarchaeota archaeon]|nr:PLP-dependent aminotransferase family protein [Candidatus Heimdallarchaeota archaeon]MBY8995963.1 PLP-dependent aminotransferase family protein [Candidatus Heimdallarchaeota archaeon]